MPSNAAATFGQRIADIDLLMEIHGEIGKGPGKQGNPGPRVEVLNRSAVVLITAIWEGYCEELAAEALRHLIDHSADPSKLPSKLRDQVSKELHDLGPSASWQLAGNGWKTYLITRLAPLAEKRARDFNTPESKRVDELFLHAAGLDTITNTWAWPRATPTANRKKLDGWVTLRQDIAHGSGPAKPVQKNQVTKYQKHVQRLVAKTDAAANDFLVKETAQALF